MVLFENPKGNCLTTLNLSSKGQEKTLFTRVSSVPSKATAYHKHSINEYFLTKYPRQVDKSGKLYQKDNRGLITLKSSMLS